MKYPVPKHVFNIPMVSRRGVLCTRRVNIDYNLLTTRSKEGKKQIQERKQGSREKRRGKMEARRGDSLNGMEWVGVE